MCVCIGSVYTPEDEQNVFLNQAINISVVLNLFFYLCSSLFLTITRECGSLEWNRIQFSGCTVVEGVTDPFAILDFVLEADNISVVQQQEEQILFEVCFRVIFIKGLVPFLIL